jgi:hypothetical protein
MLIEPRSWPTPCPVCAKKHLMKHYSEERKIRLDGEELTLEEGKRK